MANLDALQALTGLIGAEMREQTARNGLVNPITLTISRDYGCGGEEIASQLAAKLNAHCYDRELLDAIVAEAHADRYLLERLDERVGSMVDDWVYSLISSRGVAGEDYRRHLAHVLLGISKCGGVIVGRGAHLLLATQNVWRVRVTGSPEVCARRVAKIGSGSEREALSMIQNINHERAQFIRKMFNHDINDLSNYDLGINTDKLSTTASVEVILFSMKHAERLTR